MSRNSAVETSMSCAGSRPYGAHIVHHVVKIKVLSNVTPVLSFHSPAGSLHIESMHTSSSAGAHFKFSRHTQPWFLSSTSALTIRHLENVIPTKQQLISLITSSLQLEVMFISDADCCNY